MSSDSPAPMSILRHRPFLIYWFSRVSTTIAFQMLGVAVGWQMYALTGNPFDLGLVGLFQFLPAAFLMLFAGQIADRYDRRRILQLCLLVGGLGCATLLVGSATGWISKEFILAAVFLVGAGRAFEQPALHSILPVIVPTPLFPRAVAGASSATQAATISGPAIGGFLYAIGPNVVYGACFGLYVAAAALLFFLVVPRVISIRQPMTLKMFFGGISYIRGNHVVLGVISLDLFAVLLGAATGLLPIFARDVFAAGPSGLGILRAAPALGALTMMMVLVRWQLTRNVGRTMFAIVACYGLSTIAFALSTSFVVALIVLAVLGASDAVGVVIRQTLVQLETPDEVRGRVTAVNSLFVSASNQLGDFRAGTMAAWLGAAPAVLLGGVGTLLVALMWIKVFPELYRLNTFPAPPSTR